ncbi:lipase/serine esteras-like protein [Lentithecium fluviatile CBS 122367]|uniref:Lipase/serine esteras-like protein n=1 Tax=Lentithecium fluviatile CBS 122367 TaxID=1168545 RepID=A0A6G1J8D0_9PLEO|nr:lipase/serine esteras-like protein [Lentithecium fluviatile CBS 122367]
MATKPDHLCVLVHGLWGNPAHLKFLKTSLRDKYAEDKLHILVVKRNAGSFTYDGVHTGGERVANEVEETLEELARNGTEIKKISVIGYSLGGLISRYAIGLLYSKGVFERIEPVNFTTFATPHLGVRTPLRGKINHIWNVLGARTLSMSGRQLFMIDNFRDTGRPLLSVLADADSIFVKALAQFKHRSLYANILNDRTVTYYTAGISQTDPFERLSEIQVKYVKGYEGVIVDPENPVAPKEPEVLPAFHKRLTSGTATVFQRAPIMAFLLVFIPIGTTLFLVNSAIQSVRSRQRIRLHEEGKAGVKVEGYRIPLMINTARREVEDMFENMTNAQPQEYLEAGSEELASPTQPTSPGLHNRRMSFAKHTENTDSDVDSISNEKAALQLDFPTLALTQHQFKMIENLDNVGFKKFPVHIQKHRHSHAAIIRRMDKKGFEEGHVVAKHWLSHFEL